MSSRQDCDRAYTDLTDPGSRHWSIGTQHESDFGQGYPGCNGLSFVPNAADSPSTIHWTRVEGGYLVRLRTDMSTFHDEDFRPGQPTWTWISFQERNDDLLPHPMDLHASAWIRYGDWTPNGSGARQIFGLDIVVDGVWYVVEINTVMTNWPYHRLPGLGREYVFVGLVGPNKKYINVNGADWGVSIPKDSETFFHLDWGEKLQWIIDDGLIPDLNEYGRSEIRVVFYLGHEVRNHVATGSGVADLRVRELKLDSGRPRPAPSSIIAPPAGTHR